MSEWQPIETAPKDGTRVLLFSPGGDGEDPTRQVAEGAWCRVWWRMEAGDYWTTPTHWIALPAPPKEPGHE